MQGGKDGLLVGTQVDGNCLGIHAHVVALSKAKHGRGVSNSVSEVYVAGKGLEMDAEQSGLSACILGHRMQSGLSAFLVLRSETLHQPCDMSWKGTCGPNNHREAVHGSAGQVMNSEKKKLGRWLCFQPGTSIRERQSNARWPQSILELLALGDLFKELYKIAVMFDAKCHGKSRFGARVVQETSRIKRLIDRSRLDMR